MLGLMSLVDALVAWLVLIGLSAIVMIVVVVALVAMNRALEFKPARAGTSDAQGGAAAMAIVRRRILICVCGVAVVVIASASGGMLRYGLNLALLPGVASCVVAGLAALPYGDRAVEDDSLKTGGVRVASLRTREPWTYTRWYVLIQPIVMAVLLIGYLTITACMGTTDGDGAGRSIRLTEENSYGGVVGGESGPFPGVYYALPLIGVTVLLIVLVCVALRRISHTPAALDGIDGESDRLWRSAMSRFVVFLSTGSMLAYAAGVLYFAGNATRLVGTNFDTLPSSYADDVYPTLGVLQMVTGGLLGVLALVYLAMAVFAVVKLWAGARAVAPAGSAPWKAAAR